jgi:small subunit ribosomal protein S20
MRQNTKRRDRNRVFRGQARSYVKKAHANMQEGNLDEARQTTILALKALDKAAQKGVIHKNNAARRKSRLLKSLAKFEKQHS